MLAFQSCWDLKSCVRDCELGFPVSFLSFHFPSAVSLFIHVPKLTSPEIIIASGLYYSPLSCIPHVVRSLLFCFFLFFYFLATPRSIWDPSSWTKDWTCAPSIVKTQSLNHWITREVSQFLFFWSLLLCFFSSSLHWNFYSPQSQPWPLIMAKIHNGH